MELFAAVAPCRDQACLLEQAKMLHDPEAGHFGEARGKLAQGLAITLKESIEQLAPAHVGERPEHGLHYAADFM
jgi:hypothetical protein